MTTAARPVPSVDPLHDLVASMDRLRSPGGCPWDAEQTHGSLVRYLLEESYELAEAIETGDRPGLREELGDVLFQVVFHARIAQENAEAPFTLDDVAADLVAKLHRRHPHVFGDDEYVDAEHLTVRWDQIKQQEKARGSVLDGVPLGQGALSRAQKVVTRARRAGLPDGATRGDGPSAAGASDGVGPAGLSAEDVGAELLAVVRRAQAADVDAEGALRAALRGLESEIRDAEQRGDG
jgi:XTP/dITP diphosphohydrolase